MADLTRERLAELKRLHDAKEDLMMGSEEFHALLDMASRCVSEERDLREGAMSESPDPIKRPSR